MLMKVYRSDPLAQLLSILSGQGDRRLAALLETVCYQHYGMQLSILAAKYRLVAGISLRKDAA
jgi:hypothetical protein